MNEPSFLFRRNRAEGGKFFLYPIFQDAKQIVEKDLLKDKLLATEDLVKRKQIQMATDLGHLTAESPVFGMIDDYWDSHKRIEACHGVLPKAHKSQPWIWP